MLLSIVGLRSLLYGIHTGVKMRSWFITLITVIGLWLTTLVPAQAAEFFPIDERIEWEEAPPPVPDDFVTVSTEHLQLHGHPNHRRLLENLGEHGEASLPTLSQRLGVEIGDVIHVYIADSNTEFRSLQPGAPPTWADATAWLAQTASGRHGVRAGQ